MPLIAAHKTTRERVDIRDIKNPRETLKKGDYICQLCGTELFVRGAHRRGAEMVRAHFYHAAACASRYEAHPESPEHLWAKLHLIEELEKAYLPHGRPIIEPEVLIEMQWRSKGRQADILETWPTGWRVAHEIQLSPITIEQLEERTNDYLQAGIDVVWYLGKHADTPTNRDWCVEHFGESLSIRWFEDRGHSGSYTPGWYHE